MSNELKIITFSKDNLNGLEQLKYTTKNELVRGLLDIVLKNRLANREFDCKSEKFSIILNELIEEYKLLQQEVYKNKNIVVELERIIVDINKILEYTCIELQKEIPSEINLSTYLAKLSEKSNKLVINYSNEIKDLNHKETILEKIRKWIPIKKIFIATTIINALGGGSSEIHSQDKENINSNKNIEIKQESNRDTPTKTKILTIEELNARKSELERIAKIKKEYELVKKNRKQTIAKVKQILSKMTMPTDYIKPKHILALIWAETRFDPNATNGPNVKGIMQIQDESVSMDLEKNIRKGIERIREKAEYCKNKYPDWDKLRDDRKIQIIFAAYNCGQSKLNLRYDWNVHKSNDETVSHDKAIWDYINHLHQQ
jgi:hypothetical protein